MRKHCAVRPAISNTDLTNPVTYLEAVDMEAWLAEDIEDPAWVAAAALLEPSEPWVPPTTAALAAIQCRIHVHEN